MSEYALEIKNITKEYRLYESQLDRIKESFSPFKKNYHRKFFALKDVNIQIKKGEKVGIIGANGAGKSTLLKIVTDVLEPTDGQIIVDGRIAALLELGAGFNQDYTGIENIRLNGTLMGYSKKEIEERMQKIIDFADIGEFIDQPVKSYSSGMFVRLAFATQIFSEPDILIVDEALSVGDIRFQQKCYRAMEQIMKDKTVVLVTHDTGAVTRFCQRVIWINHGQVMFDGDTVEGLKRYQEFLINEAIEEKKKVGASDFDDQYGEEEQTEAIGTEDHSSQNEQLREQCLSTIPPLVPGLHPKGTGQAHIFACAVVDENLEIVDRVEPGQNISVVLQVDFLEKIMHPIVGMTIRDRLGNDVIGINSLTMQQEIPGASGKKEYRIQFKVPELNKGEYVVSVAVANGYQEDHVQLCWIDDALVFRVSERQYDIPGMLYIDSGKVQVIDMN